MSTPPPVEFLALLRATRRRLALRATVNRTALAVAFVGLPVTVTLGYSRFAGELSAIWPLAAGAVAVAVAALWFARWRPVTDGDAARLLDRHHHSDDRLATLVDALERAPANPFVYPLAEDADVFAQRVATGEVRVATFRWERPWAPAVSALWLAALIGLLLAPPFRSVAAAEEDARVRQLASEADAIEAAVQDARSAGDDALADALENLQRDLLGADAPDDIQRALAELAHRAREARAEAELRREVGAWIDDAATLADGDADADIDPAELAERARRLAERLAARDTEMARALRDAAGSMAGSGDGSDGSVSVAALAEALAELARRLAEGPDPAARADAIELRLEGLQHRLFDASNGEAADPRNVGAFDPATADRGDDADRSSSGSLRPGDVADANVDVGAGADRSNGPVVEFVFGPPGDRAGDPSDPSDSSDIEALGSGVGSDRSRTLAARLARYLRAAYSEPTGRGTDTDAGSNGGTDPDADADASTGAGTDADSSTD